MNGFSLKGSAKHLSAFTVKDRDFFYIMVVGWLKINMSHTLAKKLIFFLDKVMKTDV